MIIAANLGQKPASYGAAALQLNGLIHMETNSILDLPLSQVLRREIALQLQQILHVHTVGHLLNGWGQPALKRKIEQVFDTPDQARHAVAVCSTWLGFQSATAPMAVREWWPEQRPVAEA